MMNAIFRWVSGWVEIASGLAVVISLGCFVPKWGIDYAVWNATRMLKKQSTQPQEAAR